MVRECHRMALDIDLPDEAATLRLGAALAKLLNQGDVIALYGGLGAGKTTLARGLIRALCGDATEVPSPTYTLVQQYEGDKMPLWHFDLYRLESPESVVELGWDETVDGAALIEWPEQAGEYLPAWRLDLTLNATDGGRKATLVPHGEDWQKRLDGFRF